MAQSPQFTISFIELVSTSTTPSNSFLCCIFGPDISSSRNVKSIVRFGFLLAAHNTHNQIAKSEMDLFTWWQKSLAPIIFCFAEKQIWMFTSQTIILLSKCTQRMRKREREQYAIGVTVTYKTWQNKICARIKRLSSFFHNQIRFDSSIFFFSYHSVTYAWWRTFHTISFQFSLCSKNDFYRNFALKTYNIGTILWNYGLGNDLVYVDLL